MTGEGDTDTTSSGEDSTDEVVEEAVDPEAPFESDVSSTPNIKKNNNPIRQKPMAIPSPITNEGRNKPCPCGSNKKKKRCCGKKK